MITTVSLSPAIDKRMEFTALRLAGTNRVLKMHVEGAGKAVDVALSASALGLDARCIGLLPQGGEAVSARLTACGVAHRFLPAPGVIRTNQKLYDRQTGETTEINEAAPAATPALLAEAERAAVEAAMDSAFLVLTGSLPQDCPEDWYARVIERVRRDAPACRCTLDAEGRRLLFGTAAGAWLIKPNLHELELAVGRSLADRADILKAARSLLAQGPETVVVSMGAQGALAVSAGAAYYAPAVSVSVRTTTGAGDAMVAGLLYGFLQGPGLDHALRCGVAAAAARCAYGGERYVDGAMFAEFCSRAEVTRLE